MSNFTDYTATIIKIMHATQYDLTAPEVHALLEKQGFVSTVGDAREALDQLITFGICVYARTGSQPRYRLIIAQVSESEHHAHL